MSRRMTISLVSILCAAMIALGGLYIRERLESDKYRLQLENHYSASLYELDASLNNIATVLGKSLYVTGASQMSSFASELFGEAQLAKNALSRLPASESTLSTLNRFLSQVGNYALSVSKSIITGSEITTEQRNGLSVLEKTAKSVSESISNSQITYNNIEYWSGELDKSLEADTPQGSLTDSLTELEENLSDYPTLIYDGPYSDHILSKEPLMTSVAAEVTKENAKIIAEKIIGGNKEKLKFDGMQEGKIKAYRFSGEMLSIEISKNGGYPVYMRKSRTVSGGGYSYEQALLKAKEFAESIGFKNMKDTYYFTEEGVCIINLAYLDGQTICYTDLIKIGVALDNGEIMFFEARGYLTNHTARAFETPAYNPEEAAKTLSSELDIIKNSMALIPGDGGAELRCYEFLCRTSDKEDMLVYVNVKSLNTEQIFILLKSDGGTLVK